MTEKAKIIAFGNQKGGVGKTTNTVNVAAALGAFGQKVLVIDLDASCGATYALGVPPEGYQGIYEILTDEEDPKHFIITDDEEHEEIPMPKNVHFIPSHRKMDKIDEVLHNKDSFFDYRTCLKNPINSVIDQYDYILLDTAPNTKLPTVAAYIVADYFVLSAYPERLALEGMKVALSDIKRVKERTNPNLKLGGIVVSRVNKRTRITQALLDFISKQFEGRDEEGAFDTTISQSVKIVESQSKGQPVIISHPNTKPAMEYYRLADEMHQRFTGEPLSIEEEGGE